MFEALRKLLTDWFGPPTQSQAHSPEPENAEISRSTVKIDEIHSEITESIDSHPVPYDETLLERTRAQWRQGEWESLVRLDMNTIEHHPDRAKLGLAVASAWLQQGDSAAAKRYLHHAMNWGCDKKLAAQILTAGVHNTLGRAAAIAGDQVRMEQHFRLAVAGSGNQIERASLGRRHVELQRLGLEPTESGVLSAIPHSMNDQEASITYPPHGINSYAQNFEDVMLWRALWDVEDGFYIDAGAWDPVVDSVSKAFYEQGWRGVHVEPLPEYTEKIRQDRPDEKVYQVLLGAEPGEKTFYYIPETGLSTASRDFAEKHQKSGWAIEERRYPVMTLAQIFDDIGEREIHWLKLDVEGMEDAALVGWGKHPARPWIVLLEATQPNSSAPAWGEWQHRLEERNYQFVYFDGLNRFYVHKNHKSLSAQLKTPPNVFDQLYQIKTK